MSSLVHNNNSSPSLPDKTEVKEIETVRLTIFMMAIISPVGGSSKTTPLSLLLYNFLKTTVDNNILIHFKT